MKTIFLMTLAITIIVFALGTPMASLGQTIDKLDEKAGFKDFKLDDPYNKWKSDLVLVRKNNELNDTYTYGYTGASSQSVFNYPVAGIWLTFKSGLLKQIKIQLESFLKPQSETGILPMWSPENHDRINQNLTYMFGKPYSTEAEKETIKISYSWFGEKVMLLSVYEYLGAEGDVQYILVKDIEFAKQEIESGF
jgi:hypothetical protein